LLKRALSQAMTSRTCPVPHREAYKHPPTDARQNDTTGAARGSVESGGELDGADMLIVKPGASMARRRPRGNRDGFPDSVPAW
jgi:hypothetical protein